MRLPSPHGLIMAYALVVFCFSAPRLSEYQPRKPAGILYIAFLVLKRAWLQHSRAKMSFVIDNALVFVAALFLALLYFNQPVFVAPQPEEVRFRHQSRARVCACVVVTVWST